MHVLSTRVLSIGVKPLLGSDKLTIAHFLKAILKLNRMSDKVLASSTQWGVI